jgi:hypothetical protein
MGKQEEYKEASLLGFMKRVHWEDLNVDGRIILNLVLQK